MLGSVPLISSRSRSAPSAVAATIEVVGPLDALHPAVGDLDRRPVGLEVEELLGVDPRDSSVSSEAAIAPRAVLAAFAASFHPENEATSTGERSSGGSRSQTIGSIGARCIRPGFGARAVRARIG